jgi:MOSC domain-containing protein YiiM
MITQPRIPCYKLGIRFGRPDMVRRFLKSGRTGFYCAVSREGDVAAGDPITLVERAHDSLTVAQITRLYRRDDDDLDRLRRAAGLALLPAAWRDHFRRALNRHA